MRRLVLAMFLLGCGGELPEGESCSSDDQCESGYCECVSACRDGCCAEKPEVLGTVDCTTDCTDLACPGGE